ncbi:MAG: hypothetical protein ACT4OX_16730 [Actinomycetota bacterium]
MIGIPRAAATRGVATTALGLFAAASLALAGCAGGDFSALFGESPGLRTHWHAAFGVQVCGTWLTDEPAFDHAAPPRTTPAGIHTHGDGLIHIHPQRIEEAGANATLGAYLDNAGYTFAPDEFRVWDGETHRNGDRCPDGASANVRWAVNGVEQTGDPHARRLADAQVIVIALAPADDELGVPPAAESLLVSDS